VTSEAADGLADGASVLARLGALAPSLRESELKIADYVLAHPDELVHLSVSELAERTGTSEATAIRFAQRLGYAGYSALKIALALGLGGSTAPRGDLASEHDLAGIKNRIVQVTIESLRDTAELLDDAALQRAVAALSTARRIEIYGVGGSAVVAQDCYFMLMQVGLPAVPPSDPHVQLMSAVQLGAPDVAIGISASGSTRDTVEALQGAREAGATCICLTRHARSPITRIAHVTLLAAARPASIGGHELLGRTTMAAVVDILATATALSRRDESVAALERGRGAIYQRKRV
jgi:DNA-binding MurR/RpiR family transcriptional regulator